MPKLQERIYHGAIQPGGVKGYPLDRIYEEIAFIAYHFHWSYGEIANLDHKERRRWAEEISKIDRLTLNIKSTLG
jgi:hypothetical protein